MDSLFEVSTKFSLEEYKKFNKALLKKRNTWKILIACSIFILLVGVWAKEWWIIVFAILYPLFVLMIQNYSIRKNFLSNKLNADSEINFQFYEDYFIENNQSGEIKVPYDKLDEVIETKTNFYLMIAQNQGFMISKENMPEGLVNFLRKMVK